MRSLSRFHRASKGRLLAFLGVILVLGILPATAQDLGFFGRLFGGGQQQQNYGNYGNDQSPRDYYRRRRGSNDAAHRRATTRPRPQVDQPQDTAKKTPKNATVFVDVFGDTFGQLLANGLDDALADKPEVGVVHLARGPSGLVNTSYYDWQKSIDDLLARQGKHKDAKPAEDKAKPKAAATEPKANDATSKSTTADKGNGEAPDAASDKPADKIDVAVMMIGSNDRQPITENGKKLEPGSDEWNAVYRRRALAIAEAFQKKKVPLVWVGVPIVKNDDFADDMAALNDIYRDVAARTGATYVDTWEPFSDENGDFSAFGPDVDGQNVRLRTTDGIYFTKAGARKLAHFVEAPVRHDLEGKVAPPELPTAAVPKETPSKDAKPNAPAVAVAKPEIGPIKNLAEPPTAKDGRLGDVASFKGEVDHAGEASTAKPPSAPVGRADDFRWPAGGAPPR